MVNFFYGTSMKNKIFGLALLASIFAVAQTAQAREAAYFGLEPDIITNYLGSSSRNLGYVRVTIELMLSSSSHLEAAEHHSPLLRSEIIKIFGSQTEEQVKSLTGREDIRREALEKLRAKMKQETGNEMIKDVIFTKYLYQG